MSRSISGSRRRGSPAAVAGLAVLVVGAAGCGGGPPADDGAAASSAATTSAAGTAASETSASSLWAEGESGSMDVVARVSGRDVVGECSGLNAGEPTVLLEVGMGSPRVGLQGVGFHLAERTVVCSYDRAGKGESDPSEDRPRPTTDVVADARAFLTQAAEQGARPPYFLVGQSFGGELVVAEARALADEVVGFVSMNPTPPYETWMQRVRTVETEEEIAEYETPFFAGENPEGVELTGNEGSLTDPLPDDLPYAVMFAERCDGLPPPLQERPRCGELLGVLERTAKDLAAVGAGGRFERVDGAGHDIYATHPQVVLDTVDAIWAEAGGG